MKTTILVLLVPVLVLAQVDQVGISPDPLSGRLESIASPVMKIDRREILVGVVRDGNVHTALRAECVGRKINCLNWHL